MHWGHYTTKDFIKWEEQPIALAPDKDYDIDLGAFSGTAIEEDGKLYLFYTSSLKDLQTQSVAVSTDGVNFEKLDVNPIIGAKQYPKELNPGETRDPKMFKIEDTYYMLLGTKENDLGQVVMYKSKDLLNYEYVGPLLNNFDETRKDFFLLKGVYECPDYIRLDGKEVLISSPQFMPQKGYEHENVHSNIYMIGNLNLETAEFTYDEFHEIDAGFDFYAPQSALLPDGRVVMIAWMQMWDRSMPTKEHNWLGSFTLPRVLNIVGDKLIQTPVKEIENYRFNSVTHTNVNINEDETIELEGINGNIVELELDLNITDTKLFEIELLKGNENSTKLSFDKEKNIVIFDRSNSGIEITGAETNLKTRTVYLGEDSNNLKLRIFLDKSTVEVFINDGVKTMSSNVYPNLEDKSITFKSIKGNVIINSVVKHDIIVGD